MSLPTVPLGDVCNIIGGGTPSKKVERYYEGDIPWASVRDMNVDRLSKTQFKITQEALENSSSNVIPSGSVIIATRVGLGKVCVIENDTAINQDLRGVLPKKPSKIDEQFLFYWFQSVAKIIQGAGTGATVQGVKLPFVKSLPFPDIAFEEQKRIVAVLDAAFEGLDRARAHTEANLQNAHDLFYSALENTFALKFDGADRLESHISISHGYAFKSTDFEANGDTTLPVVLTPGNYTEDALINVQRSKTKRLTGSAPDGYLFEVGELSVVMTDLSSKMKILGKPAFISDDNILHNQRIGRVKFLTDSLSPKFTYYFLRTRHASDTIKSTATGTMVRHTAPKRILNLDIRYPTDKLEQERLTSVLDDIGLQVERLSGYYQSKLHDLDDLRQSLLQKAFAGELT